MVRENIAKAVFDESSRFGKVPENPEPECVILESTEGVLSVKEFGERVDASRLNILGSFLLPLCADLPDFRMPVCLSDGYGGENFYFGFARHRSDKNVSLLPNVYAMANYRGFTDVIDKENEKSGGSFYGTATGGSTYMENQRVQFCREYVDSDLVTAKITNWVGFEDKDMPQSFKDEISSAPVYLETQFKSRVIFNINGNSSCWDRMAWAFKSGSVCCQVVPREERDGVEWFHHILEESDCYVSCRGEDAENVAGLDPAMADLISKRQNKFFDDYLSLEASRNYARALLEAYTS